VYVVTIDQRGSRRGTDRVGDLLARLDAEVAAHALVLPFDRTVGDEVQGVLADASPVVTLALGVAETGLWSVGIGVGAVDEPLADSARASSGRAFTRARDAVDRAKSDPQHLAVTGVGDAAADAEAVLRLLVAVIERRSEPGREAAALVAQGDTQTEVARQLGVSRQAVGQRLAAALWRQEQTVRPAATRLLAAAHDATLREDTAGDAPEAGAASDPG
jgi:hypothetical protein